MYDLSDMPPGNRTFLRQRTMYVPLISSSNYSTTNSVKVSKVQRNKLDKNTSEDLDDEDDSCELKSYLRYLIHLR